MSLKNKARLEVRIIYNYSFNKNFCLARLPIHFLVQQENAHSNALDAAGEKSR